MRGIKKILILLTMLIAFSNLNAKEIPYSEEVDSVAELFDSIANTKSDKLKKEINTYLIGYLKSFLQSSESLNADFSTVKNLSVLKSDDNLLRIYTWNLAYNDGSFQYFGFLQYKDKKGVRIYFLDDKKFGAGDATRLFQTNSEWYGALYYEIVTKKWNSITYYTLIGYDGADFLINRKVVEVLYFDRKGIPVFGKKIFKLNRTNTGRLIFEYADRATMILRFNDKQDMIILDHLAPPELRFTNMFHYYGPDFSYDAFIFRGGKWILQTDIDPEVAINYKREPKINSLRKRGVSKNF
jgi:hypothetical protein